MNQNKTTIKPGYKKTPVGVIPEDWEVKILNDIAVNKGLIRGPFGGALKKEVFVEDGYKVYQQQNAIYKDETIGNYFVDESKFQELIRFSVQKDDFIVSCSGTIGKIFKIPSNFKPGIINQALLLIRIDNKKVDYRFFDFIFISDAIQKRILESQGGAMKNLVGMDLIRKTNFPIPPLPEQKAIADCLSTWDEAIQLQEKMIERKKEQKKGLMQGFFNGQLTIKDGQLIKANDGEDFTEEWEEVRLGEIGEFKTSSVNKIIEDDEIKVKLLNYMDVYRNTHINSSIDFQVTSAKPSQIESSSVKLGDIFFTPSSETRDDIGHSAVVKEEIENVVFSYHLVRMRPQKERLGLDFSGYVFNNYKILKEFSRRATGSTRYTLSIKDFRDIQTKIPNLKTQKDVANILQSADKEIELLKEKLKQLKLQKKGLMQLLLTGEKRLVR